MFDQLTTHPADNGCLILDDALPYLECSAESASRCGDRWLIYATVNHGDVLETDGIPAIQHRR